VCVCMREKERTNRKCNVEDSIAFPSLDSECCCVLKWKMVHNNTRSHTMRPATCC